MDIKINLQKFNQISKKLFKVLDHKPVNLSDIHESLAMSFNFNNYHDIQTFFKSENTTTSISILDLKSFLNFCLLEKDSDLWKVRANELFGLMIDIINKCQMEIKDIYRFYEFDFFIEKSRFIPDNQEHLNFLNTLPGFTHNNLRAETAKQFGFLTMQICAYIKEFDVLANNNIVLFDPKINYKKEFKENSWLEDPTFLLIKNDFNGSFDTITLIRKATTILNNKKRQHYYSFLQFLYHNMDQFKIYSAMI